MKGEQTARGKDRGRGDGGRGGGGVGTGKAIEVGLRLEVRVGVGWGGNTVDDTCENKRKVGDRDTGRSLVGASLPPPLLVLPVAVERPP